MGSNGMSSNVQYEYDAQVQSRHAGRFLFVVSHMRSFSSLLCHILGSHPEISGYSEAHLSYFGRLDLQRLTRKVQQDTGDALLGRYVLDKILHNHREIALSVLDRPELKVLFLLRNPEDTFQSILNLNRIRGTRGRFGDPARVLEYYVKRLQQLEGYCAQLGAGALFIESEKLISDIDPVLANLSHWLELSEPLTAGYRTFRFTGAPGHGDPSSVILAGSVVRDDGDRHKHYIPVPISDELLRQGIEAHAACRSGLAKRCAPG
jgi:hypothetical protein